MIDLNNTVSDDEVFTVAESIYDGWYAETGRVDWDEFIDRLERYENLDHPFVPDPRFTKILEREASHETG